MGPIPVWLGVLREICTQGEKCHEKTGVMLPPAKTCPRLPAKPCSSQERGMQWSLPHCLWKGLTLQTPWFLNSAAAKSLQSCPTLWPQRRQPTRLPRPWDSPGKNTGVGCHSLLASRILWGDVSAFCLSQMPSLWVLSEGSPHPLSILLLVLLLCWWSVSLSPAFLCKSFVDPCCCYKPCSSLGKHWKHSGFP